jgi:naphthalene 1,2-dioxygenase system ferredoxin subunit
MSALGWQSAMMLDDLRANQGVMAFAFGRLQLAIYEVDGEIFATANRCTHAGARLSEGYLDGFLIECPLHQGLFDIRTGEVAGPPCIRPVRTYPARVELDIVQIGLPLTEAEG